jgi:fumarate hydratase class II
MAESTSLVTAVEWVTVERTPLNDATPLTVGQERSGRASQPAAARAWVERPHGVVPTSSDGVPRQTVGRPSR